MQVLLLMVVLSTKMPFLASSVSRVFIYLRKNASFIIFFISAMFFPLNKKTLAIVV